MSSGSIIIHMRANEPINAPWKPAWGESGHPPICANHASSGPFYLIGLRTHSIAAFNSDTGYSP
jgi:hypothetical protein